jgi:hypothetical protein
MKNQLFKPEGIEGIFEKWKKVLESGESGLVWWFPYSDMLWRFEDFKNYLKSNNITFQEFDFFSMPINDTEDLAINQEKAVLVKATSSQFTDQNYMINHLLKNNRLFSNGLIIFCEQLEDPNIEKIDLDINQNQFYYALYNQKNSYKFINYLTEKWKLRIGQNEVETIYHYLGGHTWLIKEAIRQIKNNAYNAQDAIHSEVVLKKATQIYKKALSISNNEHQIEVFKKYNFLIENTNKLFPIYAEIEKKNNSIKVVSDQLIINNNSISHYFSSQEKNLLIFLLNNSGNDALSRENCAFSIWGDNEDYEEWSLDQIIYRLRKKIDKHKINIKIETVKGIGYRLKKN